MVLGVGDRATADWANKRLITLAATVSVPVPTANAVASLTVNYPPGYFPNGVAAIQLTVGTGDPSIAVVSWSNSTSTGFNINIKRSTAVNTTVSYLVIGNPD